jgi:hypothetical protein
MICDIATIHAHAPSTIRRPGKGSSKTPHNIFLQKVNVEIGFFAQFCLAMSVFARLLFRFYRVFGCSAAMGVKKHTKKTFFNKRSRSSKTHALCCSLCASADVFLFQPIRSVLIEQNACVG